MKSQFARLLAAAAGTALAAPLVFAGAPASADPTPARPAYASAAQEVEEELPEAEKMEFKYRFRHEGRRYGNSSAWWYAVDAALVKETGQLDSTIDTQACLRDLGTGELRWCKDYVHDWTGMVLRFDHDGTWAYNQRLVVRHPGGPRTKPATLVRTLRVPVGINFAGSPYGRDMLLDTWPLAARQKVVLQKRTADGWRQVRTAKMTPMRWNDYLGVKTAARFGWRDLPNGRYRAKIAPVKGRAGAVSEVVWIGRPRP